eukprot:11278320-Karenia_brevis.AAC.1
MRARRYRRQRCGTGCGMARQAGNFPHGCGRAAATHVFGLLPLGRAAVRGCWARGRRKVCRKVTLRRGRRKVCRKVTLRRGRGCS